MCYYSKSFLEIMPAAILGRGTIPTSVVNCLTDAYRATCQNSRIFPCCYAFRFTPTRLPYPFPWVLSEAFAEQPITAALLIHVP